MDYYWSHQGTNDAHKDTQKDKLKEDYQRSDSQDFYHNPSLINTKKFIYDYSDDYNRYKSSSYMNYNEYNDFPHYDPYRNKYSKKNRYAYDNGYNSHNYHNSNYSHNHHHYSNYPHNHQNYNYNSTHHAPLSREDEERKKIAEENKRIVKKNPEFIDKYGVKTIDLDYDFSIEDKDCEGIIIIEDYSSIDAAIQSYSKFPDKKICLLNFANSIKPGGGYLNGRNAQEECLCRQTLLYPTIDGNYMYTVNRKNGSRPEASDIMIYSPNVLVIRDNNYNKIDPFKINIISSAAVDNRSGNIKNSSEIMKNRIRRIIMTAASENNDILILGAFGCGVFKNDPNETAKNFYDVLVDEGFKSHFEKIIFPIYNNPRLYHIFKSILNEDQYSD